MQRKQLDDFEIFKSAKLLLQNQSDIQIANLQIWSSGQDFVVLRSKSSSRGEVALRIPRGRFIVDDNDDGLDSLELLKQELILANHAKTLGIPVARPFEILSFDDQSILISEFVEGDSSTVRNCELGEHIRRLHDGPSLVAWRPVNQVCGTLHESLALLLDRRFQVIERLTQRNFNRPALDALRRIANWEEAQESVLHMDARLANCIAREGKIAALVDWSNSLLGDPLLELARIDECANFDDQFRSGYGVAPSFARAPREVELVYRLYTTTVLAIVFLTDAFDKSQADHYLNRTYAYCDELTAMS